jgi:hypothetical protein
MQSYLREGWKICRVIWKKAGKHAELSERRLDGQYAELSERRLDNMQSYLRESWTICRVM